MAGILDEVAGAVVAVASSAASAPSGPVPEVAGQASVADRLAAVENFVITWGPTLEKLAPLLEKLESL